MRSEAGTGRHGAWPRLGCRAPLLAACLATCTQAADTNAPIETTILAPVMQVTATPLPAPAFRLGRAVTVLPAAELDRAAAQSVPELLETQSPAVVLERGARGVQADLSIRGSTFQQVLVTLDGLPLTDSQTAHHNMDLPFPLSALERIAVIPGPGSAWFGPTALAGVVELVPRRPTASGCAAETALGSFDTRRVELAVDGVRGGAAAVGAAAYETSDGFQEGTDYAIWSAWTSGWLDAPSGPVRISVGHADKDFGARDFYAAYPSRERTETTLVDVAPGLDLAAGWHLDLKARYRRHTDTFVLDEDRPSLYRNRHETDSFVERITLIAPQTAWGTTAVGIERSDAMLDSSSLGRRDARVSSGFVQHRMGAEHGLDLGVRVDRYGDWGTETAPSAAAALPVADRLLWRTSVARGFRPPSFTELYYRDPVNEGNDRLKPEEAWGAETGLDWNAGDGSAASLTVFVRDTKRLIDWVRESDDQPWQAANAGEATFTGVEAGCGSAWRGWEWQADYRYTDVEADTGGSESKYALNAARHDVRLVWRWKIAGGLSATVQARYRDVPALDRYWLMNATLAQRVGSADVFARASNLFDTDYQEIPGVPTAGRYLEAGLKLRL